MNGFRWTAIILVIGLAACGSPDAANESAGGVLPAANDTIVNEAGGQPGSRQARALLQTVQGAPAGSATATSGEGEILLAIRAEGLPPGSHGVHVHATGRCDPPAFAGAGGHWNPGNRQHGLDNPQGHHAGDMPNLIVAGDGTGTLEYRLEGASLDGLLDGDGSALVVHATADDQRTDPSGNSGDRIACGVFAAG